MEAATLTSPQRPKLNDVPVQKSLSLPSYARAGGGGIDHKLIFAALEQKEKGRRKSRLFTREKKNSRTTNIFCLPIPSSRHEKCRETSFSSDTSCSSLEYQKPKKAELKTKDRKDRSEYSNEKLSKTIQSEENKTFESRSVRTGSSDVTQLRRSIHSEVVGSSEVTKVRHSFHSETFGSNSNELPTITKTVDSSVSSEVVRTVEVRRSPIDHVVRLNVGSSDSMERSSRSSTDSFSRKERLVAIKARVEAEREKYGDSSSEEESRTTMSRYSSDGSLHRSVRDMKSKSSRTERRLRRRSQGEWSIPQSLGFPSKSSRKKLSLLNTEENNVQSSLERSTKINNDSDHLITNTDFCPSPNFPDLVMKKNYFSDFPSRENSARFVQARIRHLEDEERKRRSGSDLREKVITPPRQSPLTVENVSPASTERRFQSEKQNSSGSSIFEKNANPSSVDLVGRCSPLPRSSQAPTPPPRSPKSINFVNKAIIQHQNASLRNKEKNQEMSPGVSYPEVLDQLNDISDVLCNNMKYSAESLNNSTEKHKFRELINNRRKTCGNFDFMDKSILSDLCSIKNPVNSSNSISTANKKISSVLQIKDQENKSFLTGSETPYAPLEEDNKNIKSNSKWQENDQKHEYMFNSLESKKSSVPTRHMQRVPSKNQACLCRMFPGENFMCICKSDLKEKNASLDDMPSLKKEFFNPLNEKNVCVLPIKNSLDRLCKSEVNISSREQNKITLAKLTQDQSSSFKSASAETNDLQNRRNYQKSASDNLESAMEELENVYRSLKFSSDNLSDLINVSNTSLSDNGSKDMKLSSNDVSIKSEPIFKRRLSVCETNWKNDPHKISINIGKPNKNPLKTISALSSLGTSASYDKDLATNQLSIDELFKNMTQQLDNLEQNLLKNSENKDSQKCTYEGLDKNRFNDNQVSQISIRKQFYDNLCKSSQTPPMTQVSAVNPKVNADRKKHKAVRSLSENISYLMTSPNSTKDKKVNAEEKSNSPHSHLLDQPHNGSINYDPSTPNAVCKPSNLFANKSNSEAAQYPVRGDEIRHIRVSMDSDSKPSTKPTASDSFKDSKQQYARLSSALSCPSKSETVQNIVPKTGVLKPNKDSLPKESVLKDSVDVEGLEQLLNSLLGEVPDRQQSSSQGLSSCPATPPSAAVQFKDLKSNRALFPLKMDFCVSSKPKKVPNSECPLKNIKPQENAQKFNNFSQNNNGQSFIPVYTKKTETCHNFNKNPKDDKCPSKRADSPEPTKSLHFGHSPPLRQRVLPDSNEKTPPVKTWSMHMRRRSVGFEDMTSMASRYGYNLTNDQRVKTRSQNCNVESGPNSFAKSNTNLENHKDIATKLKTESENGSIARGNQNIQISSENENNHILKGSKPSQYLKDKSSKRKSSLNRIDFIDYSSCTGNNHLEKTLHQTHSSSDEDDLKSLHSKPDSYSTNSKRKHNRDSSSPSLLKAADRKNNEVPPSNSTASKSRCNPLPRSLQRCHLKMRQHKRTHSHLQKLSHSAGELESLTDHSEPIAGSCSKVCLSAQEFDTHESRHLKKHSQVYQPARSTGSPWKKNCENSSHCLNTKPSDQSLKKTDPGDSSVKDPNCCETIKTTEPVLGCLQLNGLNLKHMDSHSDDEVAQSITRMANLDISQEPCPNPTPGDTEVYLSAEENLDDSDKRRGSILRKTTSEEKRELHGILKPPSEENLRTLPSILKHRESSEEKEMWLQGGNDLLHSILKKSTSEEESCNSGSDGIRPILKLSTDDESPSGNGPPSSRPRPILKKRTSFSEECYYASYPNGELKPILKKKLSASARSSSTDHPRPILKCRRKSEDVKSFSEFVASRPRAYSADAGVVKRSSDDGGIYKEL